MSWINDKRGWDAFTDDAELEVADATENSKRLCTNQQQENPDPGLGSWPSDGPQLESMDFADLADFSTFIADPQALGDQLERDGPFDMVSSGDEESQLEQGLFDTETRLPRTGARAYPNLMQKIATQATTLFRRQKCLHLRKSCTTVASAWYVLQSLAPSH